MKPTGNYLFTIMQVTTPSKRQLKCLCLLMSEFFFKNDVTEKMSRSMASNQEGTHLLQISLHVT